MYWFFFFFFFSNCICTIATERGYSGILDYYVVRYLWFGISNARRICNWSLQNIPQIFSWFGIPLRWRHNEWDGVSNHQPHDCSLNRLSGRRSKKTSKPRVTGLCAGNSPHKWPVTRKPFPFDDVFMHYEVQIPVCVTTFVAALPPTRQTCRVACQTYRPEFCND